MKLQKQISFLENNSDFIISGHNAYLIKNDALGDLKLQEEHQTDASSKEVKQGHFILTLTSVFRNVINDLDLDFGVCINCDTILFSQLGEFGKFHFHKDIRPAYYRVHDSGVWSLRSSKEKEFESSKTFLHLYDYYFKKQEKVIYLKMINLYSYKKFCFYSILKANNEWNKIFKNLFLDFYIFLSRGYFRGYAVLLRKVLSR